MSETSPDPADSMIRREERLAVSIQRYATERVLVERVIVIEQRTITTEVRREEIRITREPPPDRTLAPALSEDTVPEPIVMILHEEQIRIVKAVVPYEQLTVTIHQVTGSQQIIETLRREEIELHSADVNVQPDGETASPE